MVLVYDKTYVKHLFNGFLSPEIIDPMKRYTADKIYLNARLFIYTYTFLNKQFYRRKFNKAINSPLLSGRTWLAEISIDMYNILRKG